MTSAGVISPRSIWPANSSALTRHSVLGKDGRPFGVARCAL